MKCLSVSFQEEHKLKLSLPRLYDRLKEIGYNPDYDEHLAARGRLVVRGFGGCSVVISTRNVWSFGQDPEKARIALVSALDLLERERPRIIFNG
jgi:hypothetical protein